VRLADVDRGTLPTRPRPDSPELPPGGETAARARLDRFDATRYAERADVPAFDGTSKLSPYLHFGCVSPLEVAERCAASEAFVRQLCWRDFHHQLLAARPETAQADIHPGRRQWRDDPAALEAWKCGETGVPLVDAGMKQLLREGWMHNRVRMVVASYLTKNLGIDWREGAAHFERWLVDADVANNRGNWQWVAGTGTDTRPNRRLSPERQAQRFDPGGVYVERYR
jgi:deoxyribodipyrimidine photo-lyase